MIQFKGTQNGNVEKTNEKEQVKVADNLSETSLGQQAQDDDSEELEDVAVDEDEDGEDDEDMEAEEEMKESEKDSKQKENAAELNGSDQVSALEPSAQVSLLQQSNGHHEPNSDEKS